MALSPAATTNADIRHRELLAPYVATKLSSSDRDNACAHVYVYKYVRR
jgi:hypothetical protein